MTQSAHPEDLDQLLHDHAERQPESIALLAPGRQGLGYVGLYPQVRYCAAQLGAAGLDRTSRNGRAFRQA